MVETRARVISNEPLAAGIHRLRLAAGDAAKGARPGQFVHIGLGDGGHILRRPISLLAACQREGLLDLVIQAAGAGTQMLCAARPGDEMALLGPLGRGFDTGEARLIYGVGGGVGVPPVRFALDSLGAGQQAHAFFGYRGAAYAYGHEGLPYPVAVATDDGSLGERGLVTAPLARAMARRRPDLVVACGPAAMLRAVAALCGEAGVPCQVSLEEYMGCGLGACLVCSCRVKAREGTAYARVCADGPVFNAQEVVFDAR